MSSQFLANLLIDNVFIGSRYAAEDDQFLEQNQIKGIINLVRHIVPNRFSGSFVSYLSFSIQDNGVLLDDDDQNLSQAMQFIQQQIKNDDQVLIQSEYGENRGVVFCAAYLIHRFHWPPNEALQFVGANRPDIKPTQQFLSQLKKFAERRKAKYGPFKNIFSLKSPPIKMNDMELVCRNTFLNYYKMDELEGRNDLIIEKQSAMEKFKQIISDGAFGISSTESNKQPETRLRPEAGTFQTPQLSARTMTKQAGSAGSIFSKPPEAPPGAPRPGTQGNQRNSAQKTPNNKNIKVQQKIVKFRDGLTYSQPDIRGASFDQYNKPVYRSYSSALFRGKTSSYRNNQVTCNLPLLSEGLIEGLVSLGIDYDIPGIHKRRKPENELVNNFNALVRNKAVSILRVSTEASRKFVEDASEQMLINEYVEQLEKQRQIELDRFGLDLDDFSVAHNTSNKPNNVSQLSTHAGNSTRNTSLSSQNDERPETYGGIKKPTTGMSERDIVSTDDKRQPKRKFRDIPVYTSVVTDRSKSQYTTSTNFNQFHSQSQPYISPGGFKGSNKTRPPADNTFPRLSTVGQSPAVQIGLPNYSRFAKQPVTTNPVSHLPTVDQNPLLKKLYKHTYK